MPIRDGHAQYETDEAREVRERLAHALQLVLFHPSAVHSAYGEGPEDAADFAIRSRSIWA